MPPEILDIYNRDGEFQHRTIERGLPIAEGDFIIAAHIWIRNRRGEYLIQKRADNVAVHPGYWATTAGAISSGEAPRQGAQREVLEELGVSVEPDDLQYLFESSKNQILVAVWLVEKEISLAQIQLDPVEVADVDWASKARIADMLAKGTFFDYGPGYFKAVFGA
jgi:8-oxo-dGTP pyrophosphatase MutT (NUDIX family)